VTGILGHDKIREEQRSIQLILVTMEGNKGYICIHGTIWKGNKQTRLGKYFPKKGSVNLSLRSEGKVGEKLFGVVPGSS